jgi:hypothetical protein
MKNYFNCNTRSIVIGSHTIITVGNQNYLGIALCWSFGNRISALARFFTSPNQL